MGLQGCVLDHSPWVAHLPPWTPQPFDHADPPGAGGAVETAVQTRQRRSSQADTWKHSGPSSVWVVLLPPQSPSKRQAVLRANGPFVGGVAVSQDMPVHAPTVRRRYGSLFLAGAVSGASRSYKYRRYTLLLPGSWDCKHKRLVESKAVTLFHVYQNDGNAKDAKAPKALPRLQTHGAPADGMPTAPAVAIGPLFDIAAGASPAERDARRQRVGALHALRATNHHRQQQQRQQQHHHQQQQQRQRPQ